jgi:hypothetical protein
MIADTRVYGGKPQLIHIDDGQRAVMGVRIAEHLERRMRDEYQGERTPAQRVDQDLCPGCYMVAGFNMMLTLADANNQSRTELARSMRNAFDLLLKNPEMGLTEEITVLLDPCDIEEA